MNNIVIAGFGQPVLDLIQNFKTTFEVTGVILDYNRRSKYPQFYADLEQLQIPIISFEEASNSKVDAIVVVNFNKIINVNEVNVPFLLNIHMGLLPIYRGNSANSWSILNGQRKVGYTLHSVSDVLDGGEIFYKFQYKIKEDETYFEAKKAMNTDLKETLPIIVSKIIAKEIKGTNQENKKFIYASKLVPEDGILEHWNYKTEDIINKKIVFSRPLGSGLKIRHDQQLYEINKISKIKNYLKCKGFCGAVLLKTSEGGVWIKTKDTAIVIEELMLDGKCILPATLFKIGDRL
jgi:methionyl-tRNA formyltransferase